MESGVLPPGEGRSIWVVGDRYTILCSGKETGVRVCTHRGVGAARRWTSASRA